MRHSTIVSTALALALSASAALAGKYNPTISIGDAAPAWTDLPGTDDKTHALADLADRDVVVVVFTCNSCPYAVDYEDRLVAFVKEMADKQASVALVAINVNKVPEDSFDRMKERAQEKGFNFPYLYDDTQQIARSYGAVRTPEFFVLNKDRKIVYTGAMDDSSDGKNVTKDYLREAVAAALAGNTPETQETPPVGCNIRYQRQRRTK